MASLVEKLSRTRSSFKERLDELLHSKKDREDVLDELMESLILADVSVNTSMSIIENIRQRSKKTDTFITIKGLLIEEITFILERYDPHINLGHPQAIMMFVGINGGGKTTSLAKVAHHYQVKGRKVLMVAADTFRAAAQEQLGVWGKKLNIPVIRGQYGADPAAVTYDALQSCKAQDYDLLLVDTAGRIHTNTNLMNELEKIQKIIAREFSEAPHEVLLVLDATIGQNALIQAKEFLKFSGLTGVFLSKLDGSAKGGSVISIVDELQMPIKFIGVGEGEKDLMPFSPQEFATAMIS
jgi:fused signal recognition particle receptor